MAGKVCGVASDSLGIVDAREVDGMEVGAREMGVRKVDAMEVGARKVAEMVCKVEVESDSQKICDVSKDETLRWVSWWWRIYSQMAAVK